MEWTKPECSRQEVNAAGQTLLEDHPPAESIERALHVIKAAKYADYSPVAGRPVLVWPDADSVGRKAVGIVAERALVAGAFEVRLIPVPEEASNGADAADCTAEEVRLEIEAGVSGDPLPMPDAGQGIQGPPSKHRELIRPDVYGKRS